MLAKNEREERARSIRKHLLNYMEPVRVGGTVAASMRELRAATEEMTILVRLEVGESSGSGENHSAGQ